MDEGGASRRSERNVLPTEADSAVNPPLDGRSRPSLISSASLTFLTQVASSLFALANVVVISRYLGASGRGEVVLLMAVATTLSRVGALGVQEANVNFASAEARLRPALATNSILFAGLLGWLTAAAVAGITIFVPLFGESLAPGLIAVSLASLPLLLLKTYLWRFVQADYRFALASLTWSLPFAANLCVNAALALAGALSVATAFAAWVGAHALALAVLIWYVARRLEGFGSPDVALARRSVSFGLQTHIGQVMSLGNYRLDQWILGALGNTRELGLYSIAVSLTGTLYQLPSALDIAQRPDLVRASRREAAARAGLAFRIATTTTLIGAVVMAIFAPFLCVGIFGADFRGSVDDLRLLLVGTVGIVAIKLLGNALTAQRLPLLVAVAVGIGLVVTVVLDFLLIPRFGGAGAAAASAAAYSVAGALVAVFFIRSLSARPVGLLPRPGDASIALAQLGRLVPARFRTQSAATGRPSEPRQRRG